MVTQELLQVGQRVRVKMDLACSHDGALHGWAMEGRTGTIMWLEEGQPDHHIYIVGYFQPLMVVNGHRYSDQFHGFFAPSELESLL